MAVVSYARGLKGKIVRYKCKQCGAYHAGTYSDVCHNCWQKGYR